jgi:collagenase-like PrtC family protease
VKFSVQTNNSKSLLEAVDSSCSVVRYGSEFCEYNIPSLSELREAYRLVKESGKSFSYVTPRLSNLSIEQIKKQFDFLRDKENLDIIVNDLGTIRILENYENLHPQLGRQLIRIPARSPWVESNLKYGSLAAINRLKETLSTTSLNHKLTIIFLRSKGVKKADVDWIPQIFSSFEYLRNNGIEISIHLNLIPISVARRCHTARFIGEKNPEKCSRYCQKSAFLLKSEAYDLELLLHGNAVFLLAKPSMAEMKKMEVMGINECVLTMNPLTGIEDREEIDELIMRANNALV